MLRDRLQQHWAEQGKSRSKTTAEGYFSRGIGLFHQRFAIALAIVGKIDEVGVAVERGREKCVTGGHMTVSIK
ncbi:hypothetical protein SD66_20775 [Enterobacter cloacae]|nr:hypothetical protein SD66_20775 [Enterobacter cloacae]